MAGSPRMSRATEGAARRPSDLIGRAARGGTALPPAAGVWLVQVTVRSGSHASYYPINTGTGRSQFWRRTAFAGRDAGLAVMVSRQRWVRRPLAKWSGWPATFYALPGRAPGCRNVSSPRPRGCRSQPSRASSSASGNRRFRCWRGSWRLAAQDEFVGQLRMRAVDQSP
jgi:hypothetical protein